MFVIKSAHREKFCLPTFLPPVFTQITEIKEVPNCCWWNTLPEEKIFHILFQSKACCWYHSPYFSVSELLQKSGWLILYQKKLILMSLSSVHPHSFQHHCALAASSFGSSQLLCQFSPPGSCKAIRFVTCLAFGHRIMSTCCPTSSASCFCLGSTFLSSCPVPLLPPSPAL